MWELRCLTTLWTSTAYYKDSFIIIFSHFSKICYTWWLFCSLTIDMKCKSRTVSPSSSYSLEEQLYLAFLRKLRQVCHQIFASLDFRTTFLFTEQDHQPCVQHPTWRTSSLYLSHPVTGWSIYTLRHRVHFSSSSTTRRAAVEVFEPTSARAWDSHNRSCSSLCSLGTDRTENTASNRFFIVACASIAAIT
jgi:hypothetical protein